MRKNKIDHVNNHVEQSHENGSGDYEANVQDLTELLQLQEVEIGELQIENQQLDEENTELQDEIDQLRTQVYNLTHLSQSAITSQQHILSVAQQALQEEAELSAFSLKGNNDKVCFYTGLPNHDIFERLYQLLEPLLSKDDRRSSILLFDEFLMVLVKLHLGVPNEDLAYRFRVSTSLVSRIFQKWTTLMSVELKCLVRWPL